MLFTKPNISFITNFLKHLLQSKIGEAIRYTLSNWEFLNNFLKDGRIEIDNNLLENAIRLFALGRKNWMFNGSPSDAKAGAIFYSLIETCKQIMLSRINIFVRCYLLSEHVKQRMLIENCFRKLPSLVRLSTTIENWTTF